MNIGTNLNSSSEKVLLRYKIDIEIWVRVLVKCPRCETEVSNSIKEWDYRHSYYHVIMYNCQKCGKSFMAYFHKDKLSHTIPKAK